MIHKYKIESPDTILTELIQKTKVGSNNALTRFTKNSVARGILYAFATVISYVKGYIDLVESKKFLSTCSGSDLDDYAREYYGLQRRTASKSSAEVYVYATPGTTYPAGTRFTSQTGIEFISLQTKTLEEGIPFAFIQVESVGYGSATKVYSGTINSCVDTPTGHISCTNFIPAIGGYDEESDDEFRARLYSIPQKVAQETPAKIEALTYELFPQVGKCFCYATSYGFAHLAVMKPSGADFTDQECSEIKATLQQFLGYSNSINLKVVPLNKIFIDFSCKIKIKASSTFQEVFERIQEVLLAYFEPRFYNSSSIRGELVLSELAKIQEIIDIDQSTFSLFEDIKTPKTCIPWLRTINILMEKESGQVFNITQTIPTITFSDFNPNSTDRYIEVV